MSGARKSTAFSALSRLRSGPQSLSIDPEMFGTNAPRAFEEWLAPPLRLRCDSDHKDALFCRVLQKMPACMSALPPKRKLDCVW